MGNTKKAKDVMMLREMKKVLRTNKDEPNGVLTDTL